MYRDLVRFVIESSDGGSRVIDGEARDAPNVPISVNMDPFLSFPRACCVVVSSRSRYSYRVARENNFRHVIHAIPQEVQKAGD